VTHPLPSLLLLLNWRQEYSYRLRNRPIGGHSDIHGGQYQTEPEIGLYDIVLKGNESYSYILFIVRLSFFSKIPESKYTFHLSVECLKWERQAAVERRRNLIYTINSFYIGLIRYWSVNIGLANLMSCIEFYSNFGMTQYQIKNRNIGYRILLI
jgi:hypothetical protein